MGITGAGVGLGTMALAPLVTYLIVNFGWRVAFLVIGIGAGLTIVLLSRVLVKASPAPGQVPGGLTAAAAPPAGTSLPRALRGGNFWLFFSFWAFWSICLHLILTHFVPHATDSGVTATTAGVMISLFAGASVVGRLVSGVLCERWHKKAISILSIALQAAVMVWLVWSREPWQLYLFAAAFGFGYGSAEPPLLAMIGEIFGFRYIGAIMGTMLASFPLGAVIGPLLGGYLYDFSGNYDAAFVAGAACLALAAFAVTLIRKPPHAAGPAPAQT